MFFGIHNTPVKLGKIYCNNRELVYGHFILNEVLLSKLFSICLIFRGTLFYYELSSAKLIPLSDRNVAIEGISFSPDKSKLIYFQRQPGGPHCASVSCQLVSSSLVIMCESFYETVKK